jgi:tungstate transport system substrate-binding protein
MLTRRLIILAAGALLLAGPAARADDASTLTVVGTSDVFDSDLVQSVLAPGFQTAYPRYRLHYVSLGSGAAIEYAEAGTASALIVHSAPLESRFVAGGYSHERYGRPIFWGDYVILGPPADPARVSTTAPHDAAAAFARIAATGAAGRANFVSRGGTRGRVASVRRPAAPPPGITRPVSRRRRTSRTRRRATTRAGTAMS